jgi:DNA polymerase-3 subunit epsilon
MKNLGFDSWNQVNESPDNYKILKKVPFSTKSENYPVQLKPVVEDEITIALLDFETTGLSHAHDEIIELGLVILKYSRSTNEITSIDKVISEYSEPSKEITQEITDITGITNEQVAGKSIDTQLLASWLENEETYIIAHNSKFDRPFFHRLMGNDNYRWGCSASQINWIIYKNYRIESTKLEYILLKLGYFYEGHRASIDCLAMVQMFISLPESLKELLANIDQDSYIINASNAPFSVKDELKSLSFRWNAEDKVWSKTVTNDDKKDIVDALDNIKGYHSDKASIYPISSRDRFKLSK